MSTASDRNDLVTMTPAEARAEFGRRLRSKRLALGASYREVSEATEIPVSPIANLERGTSGMRFDRVVRLLRALEFDGRDAADAVTLALIAADQVEGDAAVWLAELLAGCPVTLPAALNEIRASLTTTLDELEVSGAVGRVRPLQPIARRGHAVGEVDDVLAVDDAPAHAVPLTALVRFFAGGAGEMGADAAALAWWNDLPRGAACIARGERYTLGCAFLPLGVSVASAVRLDECRLGQRRCDPEAFATFVRLADNGGNIRGAWRIAARLAASNGWHFFRSGRAAAHVWAEFCETRFDREPD